MRGSDIVIGGTYVTSTGGHRRVVGDADSRNPRQKDDDQVQYIEIRDGVEHGPFTCTRAAFARWADERADDDTHDLPPAA